MDDKNLIYYENIHSKIHWRYTSILKDDCELINVTDITREIGYCYGSDQYIMRFIEILKDRIIRYLPELDKVQIILGIFDKNKMLHRLMVGVLHLINKILKRGLNEKKLYKSILTIIKYKNEVVFIGDLCFDGID